MRAPPRALALLALVLAACLPGSADSRVARDATSVVFDASSGDVDGHRSNHLAAVSRAFAADASFRVVTAADGAERAATADVVWEFEPADAPATMRRGQRFNHFPGMAALTSKAAIAALGAELREWLPPTLAPGVSTEADVDAALRAAEREGREGTGWLLKAPTHGGVRVAPTNRAADPAEDPEESASGRPKNPSSSDVVRAALAAGDVAQRRVANPLRVDGRAFDMGVYVLVVGGGETRAKKRSPGEEDEAAAPASVGSWAAFEFDETLLRFVPRGSRVADVLERGARYDAAWDLPSLAALGAGDEVEARTKPTAWAALERYLEETEEEEEEEEEEGKGSSEGKGASEGKGSSKADGAETGVFRGGASGRRDAPSRGAKRRRSYAPGVGRRVREATTRAIVAALDAASASVASQIARGAESGAFPDGAAHFFETLRFDFVLAASAEGGSEDASRESGRAPRPDPVPFLVEVNASPNAKPSSPAQAIVLDRLCAGVARAVGVGAAAVSRAEDPNLDPNLDPNRPNEDVDALVLGGGFSARLPLRDGGALVAPRPSADLRPTFFGHRRALAESTAETPVDCVVSEWGDWSACVGTCGGGGTRSRTRTTTTTAKYGGDACPALSESESCAAAAETTAGVSCAPPPPPPPPLPPPPSAEARLDATIEIDAPSDASLAFAFDADAQASTASAIAARLAGASDALVTASVVSHESLARARATFAFGSAAPAADEPAWTAMADGLAAELGVAPASRVRLARNRTDLADVTPDSRVVIEAIVRRAGGFASASRYADDALEAMRAASGPFADAAVRAGYVATRRTLAEGPGQFAAASTRVALRVVARVEGRGANAEAEERARLLAALRRHAHDGTLRADLVGAGVPCERVAMAHEDAFDVVVKGSGDEDEDEDAYARERGGERSGGGGGGWTRAKDGLANACAAAALAVAHLTGRAERRGARRPKRLPRGRRR